MNLWLTKGVYHLRINKLAMAAVASTMLVGITGAASAHISAKHVSALATKFPTVIMLNLYHGPQNNGPDGYPNFTPAYFSAPANSTVKLIIHSYDDGPAAVATSYDKVQGTVGGFELVDGKKVTSLKNNNIAHTLTIPSLKLNIPIPPKTAKEAYVTVTATVNTGKAGNYNWQCMVACGSGSSGWSGAMSPGTGKGWMYGTFTVYNLKSYQK